MRVPLLFAVSCLCACQKPLPSPDDRQFARQDSPTVISRMSLEWRATGVSIDSQGKRYFWVPDQGVRRLTSTGSELVLDSKIVDPSRPAWFEDLAVIDEQRVALIAQNEGIIVDRTTGARLSRFCYLPGSTRLEDPIAWQLSRALGYDPQEDRLYVQPQTFPGGGTSPSTSQVGLFDPRIDEPLEWQDLGQPSFSAGGLAVETRERTYLGRGTRLYLYDAREGAFEGWWDLPSPVTSIDGLAFDRQAKTLVVLDAQLQQIVELEFDSLQ